MFTVPFNTTSFILKYIHFLFAWRSCVLKSKKRNSGIKMFELWKRYYSFWMYKTTPNPE